MKILLITGSYPPLACGVGDYSHSLAKALSAIPGISVSVLTSLGGREQQDSEVKVFPIMEAWGLAEACRVIRVIRRCSPDIIHIQYPSQGYKKGSLPWILPLIAFLSSSKVAQTWHEIYMDSFIPHILPMALTPGTVVVVRPEYARRLGPRLQRLTQKRKFVFIRSGAAIPRAELSDREKTDRRNKYAPPEKRLLVFFGFVYRHKGAELLFDIADPETDRIVIAGQLGNEEEYCRRLVGRASTEPWLGKVTITGHLPVAEVAALLCVADAVVLPFKVGGGEWNTSIHGAVAQGTFVLTTSQFKNGYDPESNVYFSKIDDVEEMKIALRTYAGKRRNEPSGSIPDDWKRIAVAHYQVYDDLMKAAG